MALQPLIPTFPTSLPQKLFDLEAIEAEAGVLALCWLSAKVPNGDYIKKWGPYLHHGGHNRQNGDVNFDVADPVYVVILQKISS